MKCSICLNEFEDQSLCPYCGAEQEINVKSDEIEWVQVYVTNDRIDAEMVKSNLESAEIPVHLFSKIDSTYSFTFSEFAKVELYVPKQYVLESEKIIEAITK
jgi:hypothetical protein